MFNIDVIMTHPEEVVNRAKLDVCTPGSFEEGNTERIERRYLARLFCAFVTSRLPYTLGC